MPRASSAPGEFLDPNTWAASAPAQVALFGLQMLAPNIASLMAGQPAPALPNFPETLGKLPSTEDPRIAGAIGEATNIGLSFLPLPGAGLAASRGILNLMRKANADLGILGLLQRAMPESLPSKSARLYNPPAKSPRPFEADYASGAPADASGRLTSDIEGRPLVAERVVSRRTLGGADEALAPAEIDAVAEKVLGHRPQVAPASSLPRGSVGVYDPSTRRVFVYKGLPAEAKDMVAAHEVAHGVNDLAGEFAGLNRPKMIPVPKGAVGEIKTVYNDLNNSYLAKARAQNPDVDPTKTYWGSGVTPEKTFGYAKADAPAEYMAEAVRAYLADPNYIKTVAPNTAAAIRKAVNSNPRLSRTIQFNTIAGLAAMNGIDSDRFQFETTAAGSSAVNIATFNSCAPAAGGAPRR
jgi:hypothetical protein